MVSVQAKYNLFCSNSLRYHNILERVKLDDGKPRESGITLKGYNLNLIKKALYIFDIINEKGTIKIILAVLN